MSEFVCNIDVSTLPKEGNLMKLYKRYSFIVLMTLLFVPSSVSAEGWGNYQLTPYIWSTAMEGETGATNFGPGGNLNPITDLDMSFSDVLDNFDSGGLVTFQGSNGKWMFMVDAIYMKLSDGTSVGPVNADAKVREKVFHTNLYYQLHKTDDYLLQAYGGLRYADIHTRITLKGQLAGLLNRSISVGDDWVEPLIGVRSTKAFSDTWSLVGYIDVGGFGIGSDQTWQYGVTLDQTINENWSVKYGYRVIDIDYDDNNFIYDVETTGLLLGASYTF
ncbi:MAG: hypothetical protein V7459_11740 [Oceanicoccus sp.]